MADPRNLNIIDQLLPFSYMPAGRVTALNTTMDKFDCIAAAVLGILFVFTSLPVFR